MHINFARFAIVAVLFIVFTAVTGQGASADDAKVIFGVGCYDVGKAALDGRKGISKVTRGWKGLREINTVYYDPSEINIKEMEKALKESGTYKETIKEGE